MNDVTLPQDLGPKRVAKDLRSRFKPSTIATLYLFLSALGVVYHYSLLSAFGVNYLDFADPTDYLAGALSQPNALLITVLIVVFAILMFVLDEWVAKKWPGYYRNTRVGRFQILTSYNLFWYAVIFIGFPVHYVYQLATEDAKALMAGQGTVMTAYYSDGAEQGVQRVHIVNTARFVFLFDQTQQQVEIIPLESVIRLLPASKSPRLEE